VKFSVSDHQLSAFFLLKRSSPGLQPELSSSGHGGKVASGLHGDLPETAGSGCWLMPSRAAFQSSSVQAWCGAKKRLWDGRTVSVRAWTNCLALLATHLLTDPMSGGSTSIGM